MPLHVKILTPQKSDEFDGFYAIYSTAFPQSEQKGRDTLLAMLHSSFYTIYLAFNDEEIVGFCMMYHPHNDNFFLLEYMAIDPQKRSKGLGSFLLQHSIQLLFKAYETRPILIEIDSPEQASEEQEIRERREAFYRKMGALKIEPFDYILPLQGEQTPPPMELLVYHPNMREVSKERLQIWLEKLYTGVYGCPKNDPRIAFMLKSAPPVLHLI